MSDRRVSVTLRESPPTSLQLQSSSTTLTTATTTIKTAEKSSQQWWKTNRPTDWIEPSLEPVPGLLVFHDFLSEEHLRCILQELDNVPTPSWKGESHSGNHREKRWGVYHELWSRQIQQVRNDIPTVFRRVLLPRLKLIEACHSLEINDVNAIDYRKSLGDSLTDHVDDRQKHLEPIVNLSVTGSCQMTFHSTRNPSLPPTKVLLRPGTLQVLTGKARYDYTHGIRNADFLSDRRVSLTLRQTR